MLRMWTSTILALMACIVLAGCQSTSSTTSSSGGYPSVYYHQTWQASSSDGESFSVTPSIYLYDHASVPGAVVYGGSIYLYFVDNEDYPTERLSVVISADGGATWSAKQTVTFTGTETTQPVDPNPIVDDGLIRLSYLANFGGDTNSFNIASATSSDGVNFTGVTILATGEGFVDPDLFNHNGTWNLFIHNGVTGTLLRYKSDISSSSGFSQVPTFNSVGGAISSTVSINSTYYTYFAAGGNICRATFDGDSLSTVNTSLIDMSQATSNVGVIADPTIILSPSGDYRLYYKFQPSGV